MINRLLSTYLAFVILACPAFCRGGDVPHEGEGASILVSACHCHGGSHSDDESQPRPGHHDSPDACQCVCAGAVIDPSIVLDLSMDAAWSSLAAPIYLAMEQASQGGVDQFAEAPPPHGQSNTGRAMRCQYMSFLC